MSDRLRDLFYFEIMRDIEILQFLKFRVFDATLLKL